MPLYCLPAVALLPAAVLVLLFLLTFFSAPDQGSPQRQTHGRGGGGLGRRKREKVSELRGIGLKRNSRDGVVCLGWKRTLGGC